MDNRFYQQLDALYRDAPRSVEDYLTRQLHAFREAEDEAGVIAASNELGSLFRGQGRLEESLGCFQEALDRLEALGDSQAFLTALLNRAGTLRLAGRCREAEADFRRVLSLLEGQDRDAVYIRASALNNLGLTCQTMGRMAEAEDCVKQGLALMQTLPGMDGEAAASGNNLAAICLAGGRLEEAEGWLAPALAYYQSAAGQRDPHQANGWATLAALRRRQGRPEEALDALDRAAPAMERFFGRSPQYAALRRDAALTARGLGRADSRARLQEALALFQALGDQGEADRLQALLEAEAAQ